MHNLRSDHVYVCRLVFAMASRSLSGDIVIRVSNTRPVGWGPGFGGSDEPPSGLRGPAGLQVWGTRRHTTCMSGPGHVRASNSIVCWKRRPADRGARCVAVAVMRMRVMATRV